MKTDPDCLFCRIVAGEIPCTKVYEDDKTLVFADINPMTDGHTLVIPKAHHENLLDMDPDYLDAVHRTCQKVARGMVKGLGVGGVAVIQLNGREANQLVMHYHVHLVPRKAGDGVKAGEWDSRAGDRDLIAAAAAKIKAAL